MGRLARAAGSAGIGVLLSVSLSGCFSAPPQIISLEPNRGSTSVRADAPVRVIFDRPVTHASLVGRFLVSPAIPGCNVAAVFAAPSTAPCWIHWLTAAPGFELLHTGAVFAPATRYTFTLAGGFADPEGDRNTLDHHWDLTTAAAPILSSSTPPDRATDVPLDSPLSVTFNAPMDAPSTAAAISLDPSVPGMRVVRNTSDHSRFVILPGHLLDPGIPYTITVGANASGEDQQVLAASFTTHFTTGARLTGAHAVVLAGVPGEGSTELLSPALAPAAAGEPVAAPVLLAAPHCEIAAGCAGVPFQAPLETFVSAAASPDGSRFAVVGVDQQTHSSALEVINAIDDSLVATVPGATLPSWSPNGRDVAFATAGQVEVLDTLTRQTSVVAAGTSTTSPPLWSTASSLVITPAAIAGTPQRVEVVDRQLDARYALPGGPSGATAVAISPPGDRVALATADGATVIVPLGAASAPPVRVAAVRPGGFTSDGGLLALTAGDAPNLVLVSAAGGDTSAINLSISSVDLQTIRVAPDGRRFAVVAIDASGVRQAYVANADGSNVLPLTRFVTGGLQVQAVSFSA